MTWTMLRTESGELMESNLVDIENQVGNGDSLDHQLLLRLIREVRHLRHQLTDPNYTFAGTRIHRQAITTRNGQVASLQNKLDAALKENEELKRDRTRST